MFSICIGRRNAFHRFSMHSRNNVDDVCYWLFQLRCVADLLLLRNRRLQPACLEWKVSRERRISSASSAANIISDDSSKSSAFETQVYKRETTTKRSNSSSRKKTDEKKEVEFAVAKFRIVSESLASIRHASIKRSLARE